jgi:hypothetical protein
MFSIFHLIYQNNIRTTGNSSLPVNEVPENILKEEINDVCERARERERDCNIQGFCILYASLIFFFQALVKMQASFGVHNPVGV